MTVPLLPNIPDDYSVITVEQARQLLPLASGDIAENRPFVEGDHFQGGDAWVGPGPRPTDVGYSDFLAILEPAFVSKNVIDEILDRLVSAVVGREPAWSWVPIDNQDPTEQDQAAIDDLEAQLTVWWDDKKLHQLLKNLLKKVLWAQQGCFRLYVPSGLTDAAGRLNTTTLADTLSKIYFEVPEPENCTVFEHPNTRRRLGIVLFKDAQNRDVVELAYVDPKSSNTVVKIIPGSSSGGGNFGGYLPIGQVALDKPFITAQVRSLQKALNMTLTLLSKGLVDNHFLERIFLNAMPPGKWTYEADGVTRKAYIPDKRRTGGRTDSWVQGIDYQDEKGATQITPASVVIRDPIDPSGTIKGAEYWYQAILEEVRQDFVLINQAATPSGKSREQARGDFIDSSRTPELLMTSVGRTILFTVVAMAEAFLGTPGKWTGRFKPVFVCRPNYGPLSIAERQQNVLEAEKGFISDETAMSRNGIDDVDAEQTLIRTQPRSTLDLSGRRADVVNKWSSDFPREVALFLAGFDEKEIKEIMKRVGDALSNDPSAPAPPPTGDGVPNPVPAPAIPAQANAQA